MKKFSKLFWVALVVVAVLACTAIGVFAAETVSTAVVYADLYEVTETETDFSVDFKFKNNNTAVECGKITLTWDSAELEVKSIDAAGELVGVPFGTNVDKESGKAVIAWAGSEIDGKEGKLFTVSFAKGAGFTADTLAAVEIAVDNFGYTESGISKELKNSVKAEKFLVAGEGSSERNYNGAEDAEAFLEDAILWAKEGNEVTITLGADMVFGKYTEIGSADDATGWEKDAEGNVLGKIKITSDGTYGIEIQDNAVVVMYGHYEFSNMVLKGTNHYQDNCLVFPDDSSALFDDGLIGAVEGTSNKWLNIAGNVTVNSGKYYFIAGNCKGSNINIAKPYNITMQGDAIASYFACGMINGVGDAGTGKVSAKANVQILDNALLYADFCASGRYTGNDGTAGADVLICTTKKVPNIYAIAGTVSEASTFDIRIANVVDANVASALISGKTGVGGAETTINWHLDGGTINDFNGGLKITGTNTNESYIDGNINIYVNKREATLPTGCEYATLSTIPTFCAGSANLNGATGVEDRADRKLEVYAGTTISGVLYGGSKLSTADSAHIGDTEITIYGGTFSQAVYGGSYASAAGTHSGDVNFNIYGGTFASGIYGGSLLSGANSAHGVVNQAGDIDGEVVLTLKPGSENEIKLNAGSIFGGSKVSAATADHKGKTTVYLKDVNTTGINTQTQGKQTTFRDNAYICGGSQISNDGVHSGNSELIIQRCTINEKYWFFGGSSIDGNNSVHSGTSKLTIDGNTGLVEENGVYTEVEGTNGYNNLYENAAEGWFGGSALGGYYVVNGAAGTTSNVKQTGESCIEIIGTEDEDTSSPFHMTQIRGSWNAGIYGGCYYQYYRISLPQQGDSYVKITGSVRTGAGNITTGAAGVYAVGGSLYNTNPFTNYTGTVVPSSRVIIDGDFTGRIIGGFRTKCAASTANATFKYNSGVTLKSGSLANMWICPTSHQYQGTALPTTNKQEGVALLEIYSDFCNDNASINIQYNSGLVTGSQALKLIGEFKDADDDGIFKLTLSSMTWHNLDLVQATGDPIKIYKSSSELFTGEDAVITPVNTDKNIYFAQSTAELTDGTIPANKQFDVNPKMSFADLLGKSGLKIYNTSNAGNTLLDYSLYTRFDGLSSSPNAFKFYVEGANGKLEEITQIPANPSQQIIVKTGVTQSAPTYLTRHELRFATASIQFAENLAVTLRIKAPDLNGYGYSGYYLKATINGVTTTVEEYTEEADGRYKFVFSDIPPYLMAHDMDIVLYAKYGDEEVTALNLEYGIYSYARSRLDKSTDEDYKSVIVNMLNYGDAAQIYEGNYTELMATEAAGITAEEQSLYATSDLRTLNNDQKTDYTTIDNPTASFKAVKLYFGSTVQVEYRFLPDTTINPENLKVKLVNAKTGNECGEFTYADFVDAGNDEYGSWKGYKITFDKLYANQMSDVILATVYEGETPISNTLSYSIETYVSKKLTSTDSNFVALITTMMKYGDSVVKYSNS